MDKVMPSPLNYFGSKKWLINQIMPYLPKDRKEIISPFFGGGGLELNLALRGYKVYGYDIFQPLVNFWQHWLEGYYIILASAKIILDTNSNIDLETLKKCEKGKGLNDAITYYIFNRLSFNGTTFARKKIRPYGKRNDGQFVYLDSHNRLVFPFANLWSKIPKLDVSVECLGFEDTINSSDAFCYLDPPYPKNENCYQGSINFFDHVGLANILKTRDNWLLSYSDTEIIRDLYAEFEMIKVYRNTPNPSHELLIFSPDITPIPEPKQLTLDF